MDVLSATTQVAQLQASAQVQPQQEAKGPDARLVQGERQRSALKLELTTADGDEVKLKFVDQQAARTDLRVNDAGLSVRHSERSSQRYSIKIEGELDAGEREALGQVIDAALQLAQDFFSGAEVDVSNFLAATGSNGDEIASASLKLSQRSQSVARYAVEDSSPGSSPLDSLLAAASDIADRVQQLGEGLRALAGAAGNGLAVPAAQVARATVAAGIDARYEEISAAPVPDPSAASAPTPDPAPAPTPDPAPVPEPIPVAPPDASSSSTEVASSAAPAGTEGTGDEDATVDADDAAVPSGGQDVSSSPAAPSASAPGPFGGALASLREQLLAALDAASEHRHIEFEVKHSVKDVTRVRLNVFA